MKVADKNNYGITLIEVIIGVFILSLVMAGVMNMFAGGLKGTKKGAAHLTNMQTAAIVMAQIEYDLQRTNQLNYPPVDTYDNDARWQFIKENGSTSTVIYNMVGKGIERQEDNSLDGKNTQIFGRGLDLQMRFRRLEFFDTDNNLFKEGMWIELKVSTKNTGDEEFNLKRLVLCKGLTKPIF